MFYINTQLVGNKRYFEKYILKVPNTLDVDIHPPLSFQYFHAVTFSGPNHGGLYRWRENSFPFF